VHQLVTKDFDSIKMHGTTVKIAFSLVVLTITALLLVSRYFVLKVPYNSDYCDEFNLEVLFFRLHRR